MSQFFSCYIIKQTPISQTVTLDLSGYFFQLKLNKAAGVTGVTSIFSYACDFLSATALAL